MVRLLQVFHQGSTYDDALKQVYGFDQDGLDIVWRQSLGAKTASTRSSPARQVAGVGEPWTIFPEYLHNVSSLPSSISGG